MILSGSEIVRQVQAGSITILPFSKEDVNPNSYNYHIGDSLLEITDELINPKETPSVRALNFDANGYVLMPDKLYLASTCERIGSAKYVTSLMGRSSVGRLGLFVQITADLGSLGAIHNWTLELKVVQPLRIYPNMTIGQVCFWEPKGSTDIQYNGKYSSHNKPHYSKLHEEFAERSITI